MNIRMPRHLDDKVLEVQDAFLQEDAREKGIVTLDQIPTVKDSCNSRDVFAEKISIWQGDITRLQVGAIVNAANSQMLPGTSDPERSVLLHFHRRVSFSK